MRQGNIKALMREQLKQKVEDVAWKSATDAVGCCIELGNMSEAKSQSQEAINNWKKEGKLEVVGKFKEWLLKKVEVEIEAKRRG